MSDPSLLILASLADGEKHGYAMMIDIEAFAGTRLGPGTLYGQPYSLTAAGKTHLEAELAQLNQVVKTGLGRLKHA